MLISRLKNILTKGNARSVTLKKNIVAMLGLRGISILVSLLLVPMTIGYISDELYGVWLTLSSVLLCLNFFDIGLTQGLKNKLTEALAKDDKVRAKNLISTTYFAMIVIFLPLSIIGYYLVQFIDWVSLLNVPAIYSKQIVQVMQLMVFFVTIQIVANVVVSVIAAYQRVALSQSFLVIGNVLACVGIWFLTKYVPPSLTSLALVLAGSPIVVTVAGTFIFFHTKAKDVAPSISSVHLGLILDLFSLGIKFFIINVQVVVVYQTTNLLISHVSSPECVTSYNIAYKYLSIAMILYTNLTQPLWPAYTDAYTKGDYEWMKNMRKSMNRILLACSIACVGMAVIAQPIYSIWIQDKAYVPPTMTWLVAAYVIIYCVMNLNGTFIVGMGKVYLDSIIVTIGMVIYIPIALFLAKFFKEYGILLALILLNIGYALVFYLQTNKLLNRTATGIWDK